MYSSRAKVDCDDADLKGSNNYEDLFDSGYNSNVQSKTFLDSESDLDVVQSKLPSDENVEQSKASKKNIAAPQWSDSGVCITDSGLSINDDDNCESRQSETDLKSETVESDLPKTWLKQNSEGDTLLHLAIIEDLEDIACSIIKNISSPSELLNSYNYLYQTPLHLAVLKRQMTVVQHLVLRGVSLTFQDNLGNTPLHLACKFSLTDILRYFLASQKASLPPTYFELRNYDGDTCIHLAAYNNNLKILELLLRSGANINVQEGKSGKTILHWAVENLNVQLVHFLLSKCNASINERTFSGKTCVHIACKIHFSLKNDPPNALKQKVNKIIKMLLDKFGDSKPSLDSFYIDSESDFSSDEE